MKKFTRQAITVFVLLIAFYTAQSQVIIGETHTNVSCYGQNTGSITITVTGGTAPYTFNWTAGVTSQNRTNLVSGTYNVTATDDIGASASATIIITEPSAALTTSTSTTMCSCGGAKDGTRTVVINGGTAPYSLLWDDGTSTLYQDSLYARNYYLTVTDNNGCVKIDSANVTQPAGMAPTMVVTDANCSANDGQIDLSVQYGYPPYIYNWSDGAISEDRNGLMIGSYTVTITDTIACTVILTATVNQANNTMNINSTVTNPSCNGSANGAITITSVVGSPPAFTYNWGGGITSQNRTGLTAGSYTVTVTSSTSCTASAGFTLTEPNVLTVNLTPIPVQCFAGNNGAINTSVSGGTPGYSFSWADGGFTQNRTSLTTGTYTVTVTDLKGCTATASTVVIQPAIDLTVTAVPNPLACGGGPSGSVITNVSGGTGPYTYWWGSGITTPSRINVNAGTYTVTVTDDNGCTSSNSAIILAYTALSVTSTQTNNVCHNGNTGAIDVTPNNGWAPYTYNWSSGDTIQDLNNLTANTYTVTVTDNHTCTATRTVIITEPSFLIVINSTIVDASCGGTDNGSITINVNNGISPYTYAWSDGPVTPGRSNLSGGNYILTVTDNVGCTAGSSLNVNQPAPITLSPTVTNVSCFGANNGAVQINQTGGFAPYTYNWTGGYVSQNLANVAGGVYNVTITDNHLCSATGTATVTEPALVNVGLTQGNVNCFGGSNGWINVNPTGSAGPFTYTWNDSETSQNRVNLLAGNYTVTVLVNGTCSYTASATINQPATISIASTVTNVSCFGANTGAINITPSGGTGPFTYNWGSGIITQNRSSLTAATYTVTATDNNSCSASSTFNVTQPASAITLSSVKTDASCFGQTSGSITLNVSGGTGGYTYNWSNSLTSQNLTSLAANTYTVTVTDAATCSASLTTTITQPAQVTGTTTHIDATCFGTATGSIDLTPNGGTGSYTYIWSNSAPTQDLSNINAGNYSVTITDANTCSGSASVSVGQATQIQLTNTQVNAYCTTSNNGSIDLTVNGGSPPYTYLWSNAAVSQDITNLVAGNYTVTVNDNNLCTATRTIAITANSSLTLGETHTNVTCFGGNNGSITVNVSGLSGNYTYLWSNSANTQTINNLVANTYQVTATDISGCSISGSATVYQPAAIQVTTSITNVGCAGPNSGAVTLSITGGTPPYQYIWSNGPVTKDISGLSVGNYTVTVTDAFSCGTITTTSVIQTAPIQISLSPANVNCNGDSNGTITSIITGGNPFSNNTYTYSWDNSAITKNISSLYAGTYTVTVTDSSNCQASASATVSQPTAIQVNETHVNVSCHGNANGVISVAPIGGAGNYSYNWSNNTTANSISNLGPNTYRVTVTDASSCSVQQSILITEPTALVINETHTDYACAGSPGSIDLTVNGGTPPLFYVWNIGGGSEDRANLTSGSYTVTVSDYNNCTGVKNITIVSIPQLAISLAKTDITCYGANNGTITTNITGGTQPYTYTWTNSAATQNLNNLDAGSYAVLVNDANNCSVTDAASITQPTAIQVNSAITNINCYGENTGAINLDVYGGAAPYIFKWSNASASKNLNNIAAGVYAITVTDASNCNVSLSNLQVVQPTRLTAQSSITPAGCVIGNNNGAVDITVSGGTMPYTYEWNNNAITEDIENLTAGSYNVFVFDALGCAVALNNTVIQTEPISLESNIGNTPCTQVSAGKVELTVNGGTPAFAYTWSTGQITKDISHLGVGAYSVSVTDANNCSASAAFDISADYELEVTASVDNANVLSGETIQLSATASADHNNVYSWAPVTRMVCSNCATTLATPSSNTTFSVNVIDANGCRAVDSVSVKVKEITDVFIPNVFTPNNDGNNDVLELYGDRSSIRYMEFRVYNRWGEKVFESNDHQFQWDGIYQGEEVQRGVYVYTLKIVYANTSKTDFKGSVTVLR